MASNNFGTSGIAITIPGEFLLRELYGRARGRV